MTKLERDEARMTVTMTGAYTDHEKELSRHSLYKLNNQQLSEDMVQDTFFKTWTYLVRGGKIDVMRSFLYHTLNCLIIDEYRKRKTSSLDVLVEKGYEPGADKTDELVNKLDGRIALLLIEKLPEKYRAIMHMRFTKQLSLTEMSTATGQSKNALSVQIHRGLTKLKALYTHTP